MTKIKVLGPKSLMAESINHLHSIGSLHIEDVSLDDSDKTIKRIPLQGDLAERKESLTRKLSFVEIYLNVLSAVSDSAESVSALSDETAIDRFLDGNRIDLLKSVEVYDESLVLKEELKELRNYESLLKGFAPVISRLGGFKNFEIIGLTIDRSKSDIAILLEEQVREVTRERFEIHKTNLDDKTLGMIIAIANSDSSEVRNLLFGEGVSELKLPSEYENMALVTALKNMAQRINDIGFRLNEIEDVIKDMSNIYYESLLKIKNTLSDLIEEAGIVKFCASTKFCFIIEGWIPKDSFSGFKESFKDKYGDKIIVTEKEIFGSATEAEGDIKEEPPVYVCNAGLIRPFEIFLKAMGTPKYRSVDPTPFIAFFFPAFFGLIIGDVGYGVIIFLIALFSRRKLKDKPFYKDLMSVFMISSLSAIFFGFLFGELFGDLGHRLHILTPIWFDRAQSLNAFLVLSLCVGLGHVLLGFLLGFIAKLRLGRKKEAIVKALFFTALILAVVMALMTKEVFSSDYFDTILIIFVVVFVLMIILDGVLAPLEFVKAISAVLSYVRIMAIGTSSVILATIANNIGSATDSVILGIIIAVAIHSVNILISIMSPTIQSMRLQYVEFMDKFYEEGGREYAPFKKH